MPKNLVTFVIPKDEEITCPSCGSPWSYYMKKKNGFQCRRCPTIYRVETLSKGRRKVFAIN